MKNFMTGLMVVALLSAAGLAEARGKAGDQSSKSSASGVTGATDATSAPGATSPRAGVSGTDARILIRDWPQVSQQAAQSMLDRYGQPDVVSDLMLVWNDKTPFRRVTVTRDGVRHLFPSEHQDVLTEEINLAVPLNKVEDLARFDGSLLIDRTKGTVAARSDSEASNFLALNLADDIINGKRDVAAARKFYAETLAKQMSGKASPYTDRLNFSVSGDTSAPGESLSPSDSGAAPPESLPHGGGVPIQGQQPQ